MNAPLTAKDFESDQEVRWCSGCEDTLTMVSDKPFNIGELLEPISTHRDSGGANKW